MQQYALDKKTMIETVIRYYKKDFMDNANMLNKVFFPQKNYFKVEVIYI